MISQFYAKPFPVLNVNAQFYLREQTKEDVELFYEYYTDPEVHKYILAQTPRSLDEAANEVNYCRNLFYQRHGIYWTLARRSDDKIIGAVGYHVNNYHHRAEIHYDLARPYWRKGIMTKALKAIVDFAFEEMEVQRIEAQTLPENIASIGVLVKLGFIKESVLQSYRFHNGRFYDIELLGFTRAMWMRNRIVLTKQHV